MILIREEKKTTTTTIKLVNRFCHNRRERENREQNRLINISNRIV